MDVHSSPQTDNELRITAAKHLAQGEFSAAEPLFARLVENSKDDVDKLLLSVPGYVECCLLNNKHALAELALTNFLKVLEPLGSEMESVRLWANAQLSTTLFSLHDFDRGFGVIYRAIAKCEVTPSERSLLAPLYLTLASYQTHEDDIEGVRQSIKLAAKTHRNRSDDRHLEESLTLAIKLADDLRMKLHAPEARECAALAFDIAEDLDDEGSIEYRFDAIELSYKIESFYGQPAEALEATRAQFDLIQQKNELYLTTFDDLTLRELRELFNAGSISQAIERATGYFMEPRHNENLDVIEFLTDAHNISGDMGRSFFFNRILRGRILDLVPAPIKDLIVNRPHEIADQLPKLIEEIPIEGQLEVHQSIEAIMKTLRREIQFEDIRYNKDKEDQLEEVYQALGFAINYENNILGVTEPTDQFLRATLYLARCVNLGLLNRGAAEFERAQEIYVNLYRDNKSFANVRVLQIFANICAAYGEVEQAIEIGQNLRSLFKAAGIESSHEYLTILKSLANYYQGVSKESVSAIWDEAIQVSRNFRHRNNAFTKQPPGKVIF